MLVVIGEGGGESSEATGRSGGGVDLVRGDCVYEFGEWHSFGSRKTGLVAVGVVLTSCTGALVYTVPLLPLGTPGVEDMGKREGGWPLLGTRTRYFIPFMTIGCPCTTVCPFTRVGEVCTDGMPLVIPFMVGV